MNYTNTFNEIDERIIEVANQFQANFSNNTIFKRNNLFIDNSAKSSFFLISSGHENYKSLIGETEIPVDNFGFIQHCLRTDSNFKVGYSNKHLTSFYMAGTQFFVNKTPLEVLKSKLTYLANCDIKKTDLVINVSNNSSERSIINYLIENDYKINYLLGEQLKIEIKSCPFEGERLEIYNSTLSIELINMTFIKHPKSIIIDSGFSLERIAMSKYDIKNVFLLEPYLSISKIIMNRFSQISEYSSNYLADSIITVLKSLEIGIYPSPKGNGNKIRYIIKKICSRLRYFNIDIFSIDELIPENFKNIILAETKLNNVNYDKALKQFMIYLQKNEIFDIEEYYCVQQQNNNSLYFDSPKLLNEEMLYIAQNNEKLINFDTINAKKHDVSSEILNHLKNHGKPYNI